VLGARLAPQSEAAPDGALARLHTAARRDRMIPLPLGPFDRQDTAAYLSGIPDGCLPGGVTAAGVLRVTRGIPLAISLIAPALREGHSPEEFLSPSPSGTPSQLFRGLVLRYLKHIRASPENAGDLLLVYGLALSAHEQADPLLLAALWDVPAAEVSGLLDRLAERHDFVLGASRRLHRDVGDAIRMYLLDPVELEMARPMNERAVAHLQERLAGGGPHGLEDQVSDDDWQRDTLSLLWHTYWVDPRQGHRQLCHLFPAAAVLDPAFALCLTQVAIYFAGRCTGPERKVINGLYFLAARPFLPQQPEAASDHGSAANPDAVAAVGALSAPHGSAGHISGNGVRPHVFVNMLVTMHGDAVGISMDERLTRLESAARRVPPGAGRARGAATALARRMAGWTANLYTRENPLVDGQCALRAARIAVSLNPDDAASHAILGSLLTQFGSLTEAETELRRANQLDPAEGGLMLGVVLQASGQYEESAAVLGEATRRHRDRAFVHTQLGVSLLACGKAPEAVPALRKAVRLDPADSEAHYLLGNALLMRRRPGAAEASLRTALDLARNASTLALLGAALGQSGRLDEAEKLCREAVALDPSDAQVHLHLGTVLGAAGRHAEAEAIFRDAIRLAPEISEAHYNLGTALTAQSRHADAAAAFQQAQRLDALRQEAPVSPPRGPGGMRGPETAVSAESGTTVQSASGAGKPIRDLFAEGRLNEVADELYKELQAFPDSAEVHSLLGGVLTMIGRHQEAEGILREATDLNPHDAHAYAHLGNALLRMRRFEEAAAAARHAAELAPEDLGVVGMAGFLLSETSYEEEGVSLIRNAIRLSPDSAELRINMAFGLRQLGRFEEARQSLHAALRLDDHDSGAHTNLGEIHLFTGDHDAARQSLRRAVELAPHATMKARVLLGLLQRAHDPDAARSLFRAALGTTDPYQSAFAASEMSAIALTALGDTETAIHVLNTARSQRNPSDTYRKPLYDLLQHPPLAGAESLHATWQQIAAIDPRAARPFGEIR
jgi:Flp pilus assembly protein TadD